MRVLDLRSDRSELGTVHRGMANETVSADFVQPLSSRAQVTVVNQKERHSELAEESCRSHPRRPLARARFLGKLGMTFFFIRLLMRGHLT